MHREAERAALQRALKFFWDEATCLLSWYYLDELELTNHGGRYRKVAPLQSVINLEMYRKHL